MNKFVGRLIIAVFAVALLFCTGCNGQEVNHIPDTSIDKVPASEATVREAPTEDGPVRETPVTEAPAEGPVKVACVGDSITYGHGISGRSENSYPAILGSLLGEDYAVQNFGNPGGAVQADSDQPYRDQGLYAESLDYNGDIVVFMMGTNDSKPYNWIGEEAFREALETLLDSYEAGEKQPAIYLCTPAKAYFTQAGAGATTAFDIQPGVVDSIAGIVREVAEERGYPLIDIHALTAENPQWFEEDGVHPDKDGAAAIATAVHAALTQKKE